MAVGFLVEVFVGFAVNMVLSMLFKQSTPSSSPTYSDQLATSTSNTLPIPLVYGTVKQAGNLIYQKVSDDKQWCYKLVCFGYGPIQDISDIRINDLVVAGNTGINYSTGLYIWNNVFPSATVSVSNNVINLKSYGEVALPINVSGRTWDSVVTAIQSFGMGWQASSQGLGTTTINLNNLAETSCFNNPVGLNVTTGDSVYNDSGFRKYLGTGSQLIDDIAPGGNQYEKAKAVGGLKYDAYISIWAKASDQINGSFNVTAQIHGRIVRIFTTPTSYYEAWSDNPAWCILDFLTCYNGVGLSDSQLDIQSFIDAAAYCDAIITNEDGTTQKRFTLNYVLDEKKTRLDWLADMMRTCQAFPTYQNGKYGIIVEQQTSVSQHFDATNTNDLEIWWSPMDEVVDILHVKYVDPQYDWAKVIANAEATTYLRDFPYTYEIEVYGITNFSQASRLSWFYMNQSQTCNTWCKFKTDRRAISRSIGDVISLSDYVVEWENKLFRIMKMSEAEEDKIEVTCREYNPNIYTDVFGSVAPTVTSTKLPNPFEKPPAPAIGYIDQIYYLMKDKRTTVSYLDVTVYIPETYQSYKQLRYWYSNDGGQSWKFGGITTDSNFYINGMEIGKTYYVKVCLENYMGVLSDPAISTGVYFSGKNIAPDVVANFKAVETVGGFTLTWDANSELDLDCYNIYVNTPDQLVASVSGTSYFYPASSGLFFFYIRAVDTVGNMSGLANAVATVSIPSQVQGFNAYQDGTDILFTWEQTVGENVTYEVRRGNSWELGQIVARATGAYAKLQFAPPGSQKFWIKAKTFYGVYSDSASWSTVEVAPAIDRNEIFTLTEDYSWSGIKYNTSVISGGLQLDANAIYGDYIQEINLPFKCSARNWIDATVIAVVDDGITWGDAGFSWENEKANTPWLEPGKYTDDLTITHYISTKNDSIPTTYVDEFSFDSTIVGAKGNTASVAKNISYSSGRFKNGVLLSDTSFLKYDSVNIPSVFSLAFTIKTDSKIYNDVGYLTLKNSSGQWMFLGFDMLGFFYLSCSDGNVIKMPIEISQQDFITLAISQSSTTRKILGYQLSTAKKFCAEIPAPSLGVFTSMALYANI